ncbi:MAG: hypothetical protein KGY56_02110 [Desulfobacterales bacterium]|nr:hypothetical protein [Desulfobacterales bacterium]
MAKSHYQFKKRQKELAKKQKKAEKRQRKQENKAAETVGADGSVETGGTEEEVIPSTEDPGL